MRVLRVLLRTLVVVLVLAVGGVTTAVVVSQTAWFRNWLRGYIVAEARQYVDGAVSIGRLDGNLFTGVALSDLSIEMDGAPVVRVDEVGLKYSLYHIVTSGMALDELRVTRPVVSLRRDEHGLLLARLIKRQEQEADRQGPQSPFDVKSIVIQDGTIDLADMPEPPSVRIPRRIERLDGQLSFHYEPVRYSLIVTQLSLRAQEPALGLNALSGGFAVRDDTVFVDHVTLRFEETSVALNGAVEQYLSTPRFKINATSEHVSLAEFAPVLPALDGVEVQPGFVLALDGPLDRLQIDVSVRSSAGNATAKLVADLAAPQQSARGEIAVERLNLAPLIGDAKQASDLTARATVDLRTDHLEDLNALRGHVDLQGARLVAAGYTLDRLTAAAEVNGRQVRVKGDGDGYGIELTTSGLVVIPQRDEPLRYDLSGKVAHVDLRRLPTSLGAPHVETNIHAAYHASGREALGGTRREALRSADAELTFAASNVPGAAIEQGSTAALSLRQSQLSYQADAGIHDLNLRQIGAAFDVPALNDHRYDSRLNGHVALQGSGTALRALQATATGTLNESTIAGASVPSLWFSADVAGQTAHIVADGQVAGINPADWTERPELAGQVGGVVTLDATVTDLGSGVSLDTIAGHAELTLAPSDVGGLAIASGYVNADYRDQVAAINDLTIAGPNLNVTANGDVALSDSGPSNLVLHADSSRLAEVARLVNQPLEGIAAVDATVTGNRAELQIAGTLEGDGVRYRDQGALTLHADFTARVPHLQVADARVEAKAVATFVTVAGQNINEVAFAGQYEQKRLTFDGTAEQPERTLAAAGDLVLHPDHQEVHLQRLSLQTANQQWAVPPGQSATIRYAADAITVTGLTLANGDQGISADGTFGRGGEPLSVALSNVDLAAVDALLLRPPQFTGHLNATGEITGTREAPRVRGEFRVERGAFRQFAYDSLSGTADYTPQGISLDVRLEQNATQWITAKGHLPAHFPPSQDTAEPDGGHLEATGPADSIDLTIDSSPLGLGLIQGFTPQITDVAGTVEAHVRVTGSAADPHPTGTIAVAGGAFTVAPTGVAYSHIAGRVDLQPERVHIDEITVLDNHQSALSITGDLAVHQGGLRAGQLWINAEDFKVVDNKLGNVRVQAAIGLSGELRAPRIQGDFGITTGRVDLDEAMALAGPSVYATTAAGAPDQNTGVEAATPSIFDSLWMNLRVTVPNDLVIKAQNLQAPGATVGLGALNLTLGGDLTARKERGGPIMLVGAINTVRGTYNFQGRRFEILRDGTVRFEGEEITNPTLDIRTTRTIQGVEARVDVRGRLRSPEVHMSSSPPLEQADILSLIVFNQPINQLAEGDQISLAGRAQALATGALAGQIAQSLGQVLNLDTFQIDVAPESGSAAQLTLGQQLSRGLYLKVEQGLGDQSMTNVIVEYELNTFLRVRTNFIQGATQSSIFQRRQGSGADLIVLFQK